MSEEFTDDDRVMLCLAALTYRGFHCSLPAALQGSRQQEALTRGLRKLAPLGPGWTRAWGPASYRAPGSIFDDAMMFVAHRRMADRDRFVVSIRGTNPISGFDWLFGDLWVCEQVQWPYGDPGDGAAVSMSTAFGLYVLQNLRSATGTADDERDRWKQWFGSFTGLVRSALNRLPSSRTPPRKHDGVDAHGELEKYWLDTAISALRTKVSSLKREANGSWDERFFAALAGDVRFRTRFAAGETLLEFLKRAVAAAEGRVEVAVTGHSKGGALAPALALWLKETQVDSAEAWDPSKKAGVTCWAFAGPSPGNRPFATRFHQEFGKAFRKVVNPLDLVPHAWHSKSLAMLPTLYDGVGCPVPLLTLIGRIEEQMREMETREERAYTHLKGASVELGAIPLTGEKDYLAHVIHHHLDGYFIAANLDLRVADFFNPFGQCIALPAIAALQREREADPFGPAPPLTTATRDLNLPGLLALLAVPPGRRMPGPDGSQVLREASTAGAGASGASENDVLAELRGIFTEGAPAGGVIAADDLRARALQVALADIGRRYGVAIERADARALLELLSRGELFGDVRDALQAIARGGGALSGSLQKDLFNAPKSFASLLGGITSDLLDAPNLAIALFRNLVDDERPDDSPRVLDQTLSALLDMASPAAVARLLADLLQSDNRSVRLAVVVYAQLHGIPIEERDLDAIIGVLQTDEPDLGSLLALGVERTRTNYGADAVARLGRISRRPGS